MIANLALSKTEGKQLSTELKRLLSNLKNPCSIEYINSKLTGLAFNSKEQIKTVLAINYSPEQFNPLIELIKSSASQTVWDCSICNLDTTTISNWFYNNPKQNIVLSPTFNELNKLSEKAINKNTDDVTKSSIENAKFLVDSILNDKTSTYCKTVMLDVKPKEYVDNILLDYCQQSNAELLTCDYRLALRARTRNIPVLAIHNIHAKTIPYKPNSSGRNLLLDSSILTSKTSLYEVVTFAEKNGANKFIITNSFVEALEKNKNDCNDFIHFLLLDEKNLYSEFRNENSEHTLESILKETRAIALVADKQNCILYRSLLADYTLINKDEVKVTPVKNTDFNFVSSNNTECFDDSLIKSSEIPLAATERILSFYSLSNHSLNTSELKLNELIWITDSTGKSIETNSGRVFLFPGYTIVHGINTFKNDTFELITYKVSRNFKLTKKETFSFNSKNFRSNVDRQYKCYAEILVLLKKTNNGN